MSKLLLTGLLLIFAAPGYSQFLSFGVKGGIPLTDPLETTSSGSVGATHSVRRYIVGPSVEIRLPFGLSFEADALYRRLGFDTSGTISGIPFTSHTTGNDWQFPILGKYEFGGPIIRPFIDAGVTYRNVSMSNVSIGNPNSAGFTIGGGLAFKLLFIRLSPELRYTYFGSDVFGSNFNSVRSTSHQADFLVGLSF
jgi:opacity protein-like surface antigen